MMLPFIALLITISLLLIDCFISNCENVFSNKITLNFNLSILFHYYKTAQFGAQ